MSNFWTPRVPPIADGDPVSAQVANRPIKALEQRENYLHQKLQDLALGSGRLVKYGATVADGTAKGDIVYFSSADGKFAPALAEITQSSGSIAASERSAAVGIVIATSGTVADILLSGHCDLAALGIDLDGLVDHGEFIPGDYYLSRRTPGKISLVPSTPVVHVGYFSEKGATLSIVRKNIFESHFHHTFDLSAKPSASQNFAGTGWYDFGDGVKVVDYFNRGTDTPPPGIILSIRGDAVTIGSLTRRIEIYRSSATEFSVDMISGGILSYTDPNSEGASVVTIMTSAWPAYGEYISIGNTGLEVAFLRQDGQYETSLIDDAASDLTLGTDRFKIYLPNDLSGWTNANRFELSVPVGARYRYLAESDAALTAAYPPIPLESSSIELSGVNLLRTVDFDLSLSAIWWNASGEHAPWPSDYVASGEGMNASLSRNIRLFFSKVTSPNVRGLVRTLRGGSDAIRVVDCLTGEEATSGDLSILLDLGLSIDPDVTEGRDRAIVGVNGDTLLVGPIVSELVEGAGIRLVCESEPSVSGNRKIGKVRIERKDAILEGEVTSISLSNAKEIKREGITYVSFIPPSKAPSSIIGRFRLPISGAEPGSLKLNMYGQFLGSMSVAPSVSGQKAILKAVYHVFRHGFSLSDINENTAVAIQYWSIPFKNYSALTILPIEYPEAPGLNRYRIVEPLPGSLIGPGLFSDGDQVSVTIHRVAQDEFGALDTYQGDLGLLGLRWLASAS